MEREEIIKNLDIYRDKLTWTNFLSNIETGDKSLDKCLKETQEKIFSKINQLETMHY